MEKKKYLAMGISLLLGMGISVSAEADSSVTLNTVYVTADRNNLQDDEYAGGLLGRTANVGVLGRQDYMKSPLSSTSVTSKAIFNAKNGSSTFSNAVTLNPVLQSVGGNAWNDIKMKGFTVSLHDIYVDGIQGLMCQATIPTNFLERIDVTAAPATLTNGGAVISGTSYGTVDLIPKRAGNKPIREIKGSFSGKSNYETALDFGDRFGANKEWGIRFNGSYQDGIGEVDRENMRRADLFINVDYTKENTKFNVFTGHFGVDERGIDYPFSIDDALELPKPPSDAAGFQAPWTQLKYDNDIVGFSLEHNLADNVTIFAKGGYHEENYFHCLDMYFPTLMDDKGNFEAYIEDLPLKIFRKSFSVGLRSDFKTGDVIHHTVISTDKSWMSEVMADQPEGFKSPKFNGNIYDNSIAKSIKPDVPYVWGDWDYSSTFGVSVIDNMEFGALGIMAGLRYQKEDQSSGYKEFGVAPSLGLSYQILPEISIYGNLTQGMIPGRIVPKKYANKGEFLKPTKTTQSEVGIKWDNKKVGGSISLYTVSKQVPIANPKTKILAYDGIQESTGFQMTVFGEPIKNLSLVGGIAYTATKNNGGSSDGKEWSATPRWNATLALDYQATEQFSVNSRLVYNSEAWLDGDNTRKVPAWTRVDVGATYVWNKDTQPITLSCNVLNVFNNRYWYGAGWGSVYLAHARSAVISLAYSF